MMISFAFRVALLSVIVIVFAACDGGSPSRTPDEIADDSALAADLALANRDSLLIDSIGRPAEGAVVDTGTTATEDIAPGPAAPPPPPAARVGVTPPAAAPAASGTTPSASQPAAAPATATTPPARRTGNPCNSATQADQTACVHASLASADMRLNRIYRALITEIRRQEGIRGGQKDPPSVDRLRVAQRAWLVYRDSECRRRGRGREGALWARPRVRCLGAFAVRRANELADNFSRLTAH